MAGIRDDLLAGALDAGRKIVGVGAGRQSVLGSPDDQCFCFDTTQALSQSTVRDGMDELRCAAEREETLDQSRMDLIRLGRSVYFLGDSRIIQIMKTHRRLHGGRR